ncbi:hypothetical protein EXIGLDRAFT_843614 [Exidia glandulosa HHB12029]|uniref:DUF6533 domain-containing protein n=1 Tax=Exidia glandulosa HHB12029 TaxID=1314781 RepID=A0A165CIN2_EXIGL|nr:hypothetical protein EXIGLDRAFT_843614 [Exidia glandulosa HHB12029]
MACHVEQLPTILRIGSMAIAVYDYIWTLPYEARLLSRGVVNRPFMLFFFNRYIAIATVAVSNIGFLKSGFSVDACEHYFWAAPTLKVFACLATQVIVAVRTYGLSRKAPWVKWTMICALLACFSVQMFVNVYKRVPLQNDHFNCTSGNFTPFRLASVHYLAAMSFDMLALCISSVYILRHAPRPLRMGCGLTGFPRAMFEQGLLYYVALTLINVANLVFYGMTRVSLQSSAASLGYVISWIMAQRILIDCTQFFATRSSGGSDSLFITPRCETEKSHDHDHDNLAALPDLPSLAQPRVSVPGSSPWLQFVDSFKAKEGQGGTSVPVSTIPSEDEIETWKRPPPTHGGVHIQVDVQTDRRMTAVLGYATGNRVEEGVETV